jgi:hypothetical protein
MFLPRHFLYLLRPSAVLVLLMPVDCLSTVLYVHRPEIFDMAKREVLAGNSVAILGIDSLLGIGTSTLAAAVAQDDEVLAMHDAGVFWLNYRDGIDDRSQLQQLSVSYNDTLLSAQQLTHTRFAHTGSPKLLTNVDVTAAAG